MFSRMSKLLTRCRSIDGNRMTFAWPSGAEGAIDGVHRASDERGFRAGKPCHHSSHFFRSSVSFDRHETVHQLFHWAIFRIDVGINGAWLHHIYRNPAGPKSRAKPRASPCRLIYWQRTRPFPVRHPIAIHGTDNDNASTFRHVAGCFD